MTPAELDVISEAVGLAIQDAMANLREEVRAEYRAHVAEQLRNMPPAVLTGDPDIEAIAQRAAALVVPPKDGKDAPPVDLDSLALRAAELIAKPVDGAPGPQGERGEKGESVQGERGPAGEKGDPGERGETGPAGPHGPPGEKGEPGPQGERGLTGLQGAVGMIGETGPAGQDGKDGTDGKDGRDADPEMVREIVADVVTRAVAALPAPEKGDPGEPGPIGPPGKSVELSEVENFARMVVESRFSQWELDIERRSQDVFQRAIDRMPLPKDGRDGFGFEDLDVTHDGDGNVTFTFKRGDLEKVFPLRFPRRKYKGVWRQGESYREGDDVTVDGSTYTALEDNPADRPGTGKGWQLSVKKPRDGRDLRPAEPPKPLEPIRLK